MSELPKHDFIKSVIDSDKRMAIIDAIAAYDVTASEAWDKLDQLSSHTEFEEIDAVPEGIFESRPEEFEAVATVYVMLRYGDQDDQRSMSDSYPAHVVGTYDSGTGTASVTALKVDTSSFYE